MWDFSKLEGLGLGVPTNNVRITVDCRSKSELLSSACPLPAIKPVGTVGRQLRSQYVDSIGQGGHNLMRPLPGAQFCNLLAFFMDPNGSFLEYGDPNIDPNIL